MTGATMSRLFALPTPDWADREAVAEFAAAGAEIRGDDPVAARAIAARIWDRTPGTAAPVQMANQMGLVFSRLDCAPRWRECLSRSARSPRRCSHWVGETSAATVPGLGLGDGQVTGSCISSRILRVSSAARSSWESVLLVGLNVTLQVVLLSAQTHTITLLL